MTGFEPSQALANITFVNTSTGPNQWNYKLTVDGTSVLNPGDTITLTTTGIMTGIGDSSNMINSTLADAYTAV